MLENISSEIKLLFNFLILRKQVLRYHPLQLYAKVVHLFDRFHLEMILFAEALHAHFELIVVDISSLLRLVHIREVLDHELRVHDTITPFTLPSAPDLFYFFHQIMTCLLLNPPSFPILLIKPFQIKRGDQVRVFVDMLEQLLVEPWLRIRLLEDLVDTHASDHHDGIADHTVFRCDDQHLRVLRAQWYLRKQDAKLVDGCRIRFECTLLCLDSEKRISLCSVLDV